MTPFWLNPLSPSTSTGTSRTKGRLQDLDARMSHFLATRENGTFPTLIDRVRSSREDVRKVHDQI